MEESTDNPTPPPGGHDTGPRLTPTPWTASRNAGGRRIGARAIVRVREGHLECYRAALCDTLEQLGWGGAKLEWRVAGARGARRERRPEELIEVVLEAPQIDQATLAQAMRQTGPRCSGSPSRQHPDQPCLAPPQPSPPHDQTTVIGPLPARHDLTVDEPLESRQDSTVAEPLVPRHDETLVFPLKTVGPGAPERPPAPEAAAERRTEPQPDASDEAVPPHGARVGSPHEAPHPEPPTPSAAEPSADPRPDAAASAWAELQPEAPDGPPAEAATAHASRPPTRAEQWPAQIAEWLRLIIVLVAIFIGIRSVMQTFRVDGPSMAPNFATGQSLIVNRVAYWHLDGTPFEGLLPVRRQGSVAYLFGGPRRGDAVVFRPPGESNFDNDLIKRIIGLPGDTVSIQDGQVLVNDQRLIETYVQFPADYTYPAPDLALLVPNDSYFVLGDNRPVSADSHLGWLVPADKLIGQAWLSYWPLDTFGLIHSGESIEVPT